jgi:hypothetical protein
MDTSLEAVAMDDLMNAAPCSDFMTNESTLLHFRDGWQPSVSDWRTTDAWEADGSEDVKEVAHRKVLQILEEAPETLLDAEQEKAIKRFACVIENAADEDVKRSAIQGIVQYLCIRGRHDEAKKYAELYPDDLPLSKAHILLDCLQGEEKTRHYQKMLNRMLIFLLNHIGTGDLLACEAQEKIINALIPDGNYLRYHYFLADLYGERAKIYTSEGEYETAVNCLKKSLDHAVAYDVLVAEDTTYYFTTPFLDHVPFHRDDVWKTGTGTTKEEFYEYIKRKPFDRLRDREDFQQLFQG